MRWVLPIGIAWVASLVLVALIFNRASQSPAPEVPPESTRVADKRCVGAVMWFGLRAHGLQTVRDAVRRNIRLTRLLEESLAERGFVVLPDGELSIACARWEPASWSSENIDELQVQIAEDIVRDGLAWFATVRHAGSTWLRFNPVNLHLRERHILRLVQSLTETATRLTRVIQA